MGRIQDLEQIDEQFNNYTADNYLKAILESYFEYNYRARLDIAKILYKDFPNEVDAYLRKNIFADIFSKLIQSCEDQALIAIMFSDKSRTPLEHYLDTDTSKYYRFYGKARKGLSDTQILNMLGLESPTKLLKKGWITIDELELFKREI